MVFRPILERYQQTLDDRGEIDFHDMIGKATEHVRARRYRSPFGYILVDEFQDISPSRARLLKALLDRSPGAQLFAVGDDRQAIYRFGGAGIAVMREFAERFGHSERMDPNTTLRCSKPIAAAAALFVPANPSQIRKSVRSTRQMQGPCVHIGLSRGQYRPLLSEALGRIAADAARYEEPSSVLLLGRYKHTRPGTSPVSPGGMRTFSSPTRLCMARKGFNPTTSWCSACAPDDTAFRRRSPSTRSSNWSLQRRRSIPMPRSGICSMSS